MKRLDFVRAGRGTASCITRKSRTFAASIEHLEKRSLLSATVLSQVPAQNLTAGHAGAGISLSTYLNDPALTGGTVIQMHTPLGNIPLVLTDSRTPLTVANFLKYINNGDYVPTIIQRSAPGFVIQGGGTKPDGSTNASLGNVPSEAGISNTTGTIAMALSSGPDSGNNQWFINLGDNAVLDGTSDGGPFTVFGNVIDGGLNVANAISQLQIINGSAENPNWFIGPNDGLPVINYTGSSTPTTVPQANLVTDTVSVLSASQAAPTYTAVSANPSLVTAAVNNGVLTLTPVSPTASGTTTVTATVTDIGGESASSTFTVSISGLPTVVATDASGHAGSGNQVVFPIQLSSASATATTFNYSLTPVTAPATDFSATGSSVTVPAGSTQASIAVNIPANTTGSAETFTLTLSGLSAGVEFPGGAVSLAVTGTILPAAAAGSTSTALTVSSTSVAFGASDTLTATITPAVAATNVTGTVTFFVNAAAVGSAAVSGNTASIAVDLNNAGNQSITATYSGDATDATSSSSPVTVAVDTPSIVGVTITKAVLPAAGIAGQPFKGLLSASLFNANLVVPQSGPLTLKVYATQSGTITPSSVLFASVTKNLTIKPGASTNLSLPVKSLPAGLAAGSYTLVAQVVDTNGLLATPVTGSALTVAAPVVALSESFARLVLPPNVVAGSKTSAVTLVKITNNGNIPSTGITSISLYASTDGTVADGTLIKTISRKLVIKPGKSINVPIPLGTYPSVADGNYLIIAQTTDPVSQISFVDSNSTVAIAAATVDVIASAIAVPATVTFTKPANVSLTVTNAGNVVASGLLQIAFGASASASGSAAVSLGTLSARIRIQPGRRQTLHLKLHIPAGSPTGEQFLVADIDPSRVLNTSGTSSTNTVIVNSTATNIG